jgi:hypothetical protein
VVYSMSLYKIFYSLWTIWALHLGYDSVERFIRDTLSFNSMWTCSSCLLSGTHFPSLWIKLYGRFLV